MGMFFWGIVAAGFGLIELILPGLITIWLSLAAIGVMFLTPFINDWRIETAIWSILSIIFIMLTRPFVKKYIDNDKKIEEKTILKIEKKIDNKTYEVRYKGGIWTAVSTEELSVGDEVEMDGFTGNKIIVKK